jgi:hypothetical protein
MVTPSLFVNGCLWTKPGNARAIRRKLSHASRDFTLREEARRVGLSRCDCYGLGESLARVSAVALRSATCNNLAVMNTLAGFTGSDHQKALNDEASLPVDPRCPASLSPRYGGVRRHHTPRN